MEQSANHLGMKSGGRHQGIVRFNSIKNNDAFKFLGLPLNSTKREIKLRYYELAQLHHPDKSIVKSNEFIKIKNAYDILYKEQLSHTSEESLRKYPNSDWSRSESKIFPPSLLIGVAVGIFTILAFRVSLSESRSKAIVDAWAEHERRRIKEGYD